MQKDALEIVNKINSHGFEAYIVGGFVRDYCMNKKSLDVDICTNATPKELSLIFKGAIIPTEKYGAVTLIYKRIRYEITTYRKEIIYNDYRRPSEVEYVDNLLDDIKRRDFTINTLCMNKDGEVVDLLNAKQDLDSRIIKTVGDPKIRLKEDILRILRAVRFATSLNFRLSDDVKEAIIENGYLLKKLSYDRKKEELTKIFASPKALYGILLLKELKLDSHLELSNLSNLVIVDDILGVWAQLDVLNIYPFSNVEKDTITKVQEALVDAQVNNANLYKYGLYVMTIVASIIGVDKKEVARMYDRLPIKSRNEINIDVKKLCNELKVTPSHWLKDVYLSLEKEILSGNLKNTEKDVHNYIKNNFQLK